MALARTANTGLGYFFDNEPELPPWDTKLHTGEPMPGCNSSCGELTDRRCGSMNNFTEVGGKAPYSPRQVWAVYMKGRYVLLW